MYEKKKKIRPKFHFLTKNRNETFTILSTEKSIKRLPNGSRSKETVNTENKNTR